MTTERMTRFWCFLLLCVDSCLANGVPQKLGMGVIYAVPAMMGATILVSIIVIMGMACANWSDNRREARERRRIQTKRGQVNHGMNLQDVEMAAGTSGNYAEITETNERL